eukprot:347309-Chlamydomonas_euryale.AAC.1
MGKARHGWPYRKLQASELYGVSFRLREVQADARQENNFPSMATRSDSHFNTRVPASLKSRRV